MSLARAFLLTGALSLAMGSTATAARSSHSGHYENIRYIGEADDYVGARIEVREGDRPTVDFELCEGWCNGSEIFPATIDGDRITFTYQSRWRTQDGREGADSIRVSGRFVRQGLMLKIGDAPAELLRRRKSRPR